MNVAIDRASCFADAKGQPTARAEKQATKFLAKAEPLLEKILEPEEPVRAAVTGISPFSTLEFLTTGWIITTIKRCLLVVTDRRILHLPIRSNFKPRGNVSQVRFADLESVKVSGLLGKKLELVCRRGKKEAFSGLFGMAVKRLEGLISERAGEGEPSAEGCRHFICPECARSLSRAADRCAQCGLAFRSRRKALRYSLLFPGGGYFYTGHPAMGVLDGLVEGILLLGVVSGVGLAMAGEPGMWPSVGLFAGVLAVEKLITVYHANHYVAEFLPVEASRPARSAAPVSTQPS